MKVINLTDSNVKPVVARAYKDRKGNLHYNIKHGGWEKGLWRYSLGLDSKYFKPNEITDTLTLDINEDDFTLIPVIKNGEILKDRKGNVIYFLSKDYSEFHKKDFIVFWEIPNRNFEKVEFELKGDCKLLALGYNGKFRDNAKYISPAPILEVFGEAEIRWSAIKNNEKIEQIINFKNGECKINDILISNLGD